MAPAHRVTTEGIRVENVRKYREGVRGGNHPPTLWAQGSPTLFEYGEDWMGRWAPSFEVSAQVSKG